MKQIAVCLTLMAVALLAAKPADAAIIIDNFTGSGSTATGNGEVSRVRTGSTLISGGSLTGFVEEVGQGFQLTYTIGGGAPNPTGFGYFSTLHLTGLSVGGDWEVTFSTANLLGGPIGYSQLPAMIISSNATEAFIDLYNNTHATNLNGLNQLVLTFTNVSADPLQDSALTIGNITAVPEPATMALLLPTLVGGVGMVWRRRRNAAVSETKI